MWFLGNSRLSTGYWWPQVSFLENIVFPLSELDVCPHSDKSDPISSCPWFFCQGSVQAFLDFSLEALLLFHPNSKERVEHREKLGWISCIAAFVLKLLLGFVCFSYKPEHVGITDHSQICSHPPHTNKKEKEPLLFPFFAQLRSLRSFLLSRGAKEVN